MGLFDALQDTANLIKQTFSVMGRNQDIFRPTLKQLWLALAFYLMVIVAIISAFFTTGIVQFVSVTIGVIFLFLLVPVFPFIRIYYRAAQCWIVYKTFTGQRTDYSDGIARAKQNKGDVFIFGIFDIILTSLANKLKKGTGKGGLATILNLIMMIAGKVIEEGWDLVNHYLLPAAIIREQTAFQALPEIKNLRNNVPAALAGVFGFDFAGDLIRGWITFFMFLLALAGLVLAIVSQVWMPFVVILILIIGINITITIFIGMVKTVYFTLMYVAVTMPLSIPAQYRDEVLGYLRYRATGSETKGSPNEVARLVPYIFQYRKQGYSDPQIISFLTSNGWPEELVQEALRRR